MTLEVLVKRFDSIALSRLEACFKQGNPARNGKKQFLKTFFGISLIAVIAVIFLISRSRRPNSRYRGTATTAIYPCACPAPPKAHSQIT